jgi:N,N'-diacetyllegionaminate synthase
MIVGGHDIRERVLVVAEIGNNHEGDVGRAREMVSAAAAAGAHAVKFQTLRAEQLVGVSNPARLAQLRGYELSFDEFESLAEQAGEEGILFMSTPLDLESLALVERIGAAVKIASGDNDFVPLLRRAARGSLPLIISSGVSDLAAMERTVAVVREERPEGGLALLHAVSAYPTPPEQANLRAIGALAERFGAPVGYSDHTLGIDAAVLSVALGARIIEKHFTLAGIVSDFRDHALSAKPDEMAELVRRVAEAEALLGTGEIGIADAESANARAIRRSIVAGADLPAGHVLSEDDLAWVRPGEGMRPGEEAVLVGRALRRDVAAFEALTADDVE